MTIQIDTFQPEKRTIGQILSNTSPPIRVPDYQRDFSWKEEQVSEFWSDLTAFGGADPQALAGKEYFLGAAVLVNNGAYHLLLDGQQRLATANILLAALRDKICDYKSDAARQIQDQYIAFEDHLTGGRVFKIELNLFDRSFFRDFIQCFPRFDQTRPEKQSHSLIQKAYTYFQQRISEGWETAGGGKKGFAWLVHLAQTLREHMVLVTVTSTNERSAAAIFATLNDRGIGLSTVDLIRTYVLQNAHETARDEILQCWNEILTACGTSVGAEALIRMSWVAEHGDVKARALYRIVSEALPETISSLAYSRRLRGDALLYRQFRDGDTDDNELQDSWLALRTLNFNAGFTVLLAASAKYSPEEQKVIAKVLVSLVVRHNVVCGLDRAKLESAVYASAKKISEGSSYTATVAELQGTSPSSEQFEQSFAKLTFSKTEHGIARYLLRTLESLLSKTGELVVAGADRVHVEHIYPQTPREEERWADHDMFVNRIGNLTLLGRRLNEQIKNAGFSTKKAQAYQETRIMMTEALLEFDSWSPEMVQVRQAKLCALAQDAWPGTLK